MARWGLVLDPQQCRGRVGPQGNALLVVITVPCTGASVPDLLLGSEVADPPGHTQQHRPAVEFSEGQLCFLGLWVNRTPSWALLWITASPGAERPRPTGASTEGATLGDTKQG